MGWAFLLIVIVNTALHAVKMVFPPIAVIYSMRYNAPTTIMASICFFSWALTWHMQSDFVNKVAGSVLSVYLISDLVPSVYYGALHWIKDNTSFALGLGLIPLYILVFFCLCVLFDQIRIKIQKYVTPHVTPITSKIRKIKR